MWSILGFVAGLALGVALIAGMIAASETRRRAAGQVDPGAAQAEAIYVYLGFLLIPLTAVLGVAVGRLIAGRGSRE
jgi:hypothetical protein